ncbi:hypothetical protein ACIU1J_04820 [Azospirillum doebereinerae]|uniref:hypothetical protein n=1 Tax=Azospirillum doebereinerae TaxID=92933 RepID=UPI001EE5FD6E|nr:hypothetical protein [Azospirillum doebereinerae]MCG5243320.1 hypothetical protein [Azospirillum doebereinerae]
MKLESYYLDIANQQNSCIKLVYSQNSEIIYQIHQKIDDLNSIFSLSNGRQEHFAFQSSLHDVAMALYCSINGMYRQSYVSQRVALENSIGALFYSANLINLKKWACGEEDVSWRKVTSSEGGVFTKEYFSAFSNLNEEYREEYRVKASSSYAKLSDFVHKNVKVYEIDNHIFCYDSGNFKKTIDDLASVIDIISFCYCVRYLQESNVDSREKCSQAIDALVGHIPYFQNLIGGQGV